MRGRWWGVFLLALAVRVGVWEFHPPAWDGDQQLYALLAASAARGQGWWAGTQADVTVHPLFPSLHAAVLRILPGLDVRQAGAALALLVASLLPVVGGRAVARLTTERAGFIAALLLLVQPHHVLRACALEPDLLAAALLCWAVFPLHRGEAALAGCVLGFAYLDRPEAFFLGVAAAGWLALRRGAGAALRFALPFLALVSVFVLYVHGQTGRWALSGKDHWQYQQGVHQYRFRGAPIDPAEIPGLRRDVPSALAHLQSRPGEFFLGYLYRAGLALGNVARQLGWILVVPALLAAARLWRTSRDALFLLGLPVLALPVLALVGTFFRHAIPPAVALLELAGVGLAASWRPRAPGRERALP